MQEITPSKSTSPQDKSQADAERQDLEQVLLAEAESQHKGSWCARNIVKVGLGLCIFMLLLGVIIAIPLIIAGNAGIDCVGTWSPCSKICERNYVIAVNATGSGEQCQPGATPGCDADQGSCTLAEFTCKADWNMTCASAESRCQNALNGVTCGNFCEAAYNKTCTSKHDQCEKDYGMSCQANCQKEHGTNCTTYEQGCMTSWGNYCTKANNLCQTNYGKDCLAADKVCQQNYGNNCQAADKICEANYGNNCQAADKICEANYGKDCLAADLDCQKEYGKDCKAAEQDCQKEYSMSCSKANQICQATWGNNCTTANQICEANYGNNCTVADQNCQKAYGNDCQAADKICVTNWGSNCTKADQVCEEEYSMNCTAADAICMADQGKPCNQVNAQCESDWGLNCPKAEAKCQTDYNMTCGAANTACGKNFNGLTIPQLRNQSLEAMTSAAKNTIFMEDYATFTAKWDLAGIKDLWAKYPEKQQWMTCKQNAIQPLTSELKQNKGLSYLQNKVQEKTYPQDYVGFYLWIGEDNVQFIYYGDTTATTLASLVARRFFYWNCNNRTTWCIEEYFEENSKLCGNKTEFYLDGTSKVVTSGPPCTYW